MPVFGLQPQAIGTPGGFAQGFSNLGAAFLNAPMEQRKLNLQQRQFELQHAFQQQQLSQAFQIAQGHNETLRDIANTRAGASIQNTGTRTDAMVDIAEGRNETMENVAGTRAQAMTGAADTRAGASRYGSDMRYKAAHEKMVQQLGHDPHASADKAADDAIKAMPKTRANPEAASNPLAPPPLPLSMGEYMNQLNQVERGRGDAHAEPDAAVRSRVGNAADPQPDHPAPRQGPGQPPQGPPAGSDIPPWPAVPGASGAHPPAPGSSMSKPQSAGQAFTGGGAKPAGGKSLPRSSLQVRVRRGDFPDEASAAADAQAHGFSISDN